MANLHIIKNVNKLDKNYIRDVRFGVTGVDIFYGRVSQAMQFSSYAVAMLVARMLFAGKLGNFEIEEAGDV